MLMVKKDKNETWTGDSDPWPRKSYPVVPDAQGRCWHAVQSDTRHALEACKAVEKNLGYPFYYPQMREMRAPALRNITPGKRKSVVGTARPILSPIFPGYPFVLFSLGDGKWHEIFDLFGIHGMKVSEGLPVAISSEVIDRIKAAEVGGAVPLDTPIVKLFDVGEVVRVEEGPFRGFTGKIQDLDESKRTALLDIIMFGSQRNVPFEIDQISKL